MPDERALLLQYCNDHPVAVCQQCTEALTFDQIGADVFSGKRDFCPKCRADLTTVLRGHLAECTLMNVQEREANDRATGNGIRRAAGIDSHANPSMPGGAAAAGG